MRISCSEEGTVAADALNVQRACSSNAMQSQDLRIAKGQLCGGRIWIDK